MSDGADSKREQIIKAGLECFTRYGYRRTSMETIAQATGVSRPALYQHFSGKEDVFRAGVEHMLDTATTRADAAATTAATPEDRMYGVLATKIDLVVGHLAAEFRAELLTEAAAIAGDLLDAHRERILRIAETVLDSATDDLRQLGAELSAREAAELLLYATAGIELELTSAETAHARLRQLVNVMIRGLRAH